MRRNEPNSIRARALWAYELGRLRLGLRAALFVIPMIGITLLANQQHEIPLIMGGLLLILAIGLLWRGETYGRAVMPGLLAGAAPLLLPLVLRAGGHCCFGGACWSVCMLGCIGGGLVTGVVLGLASAAQPQQRWTFLGTAMLIAGVAGMLGCLIVGAAGILGMTLALLVSSSTVALASRTAFK